jgi:hypothetical protein
MVAGCLERVMHPKRPSWVGRVPGLGFWYAGRVANKGQTGCSHRISQATEMPENFPPIRSFTEFQKQS